MCDPTRRHRPGIGLLVLLTATLVGVVPGATASEKPRVVVLTDISNEPKEVLDMYGPEVHNPGSYARNCLLARRMAERDVRFVQLFHRGWDHHTRLPENLQGQCQDVDQPTSALLKDLKMRGLLEDTIVVVTNDHGEEIAGQLREL